MRLNDNRSGRRVSPLLAPVIEAAIECVCERAREAAHGVLIGAIPDLGQAV
jgi:hypothetical protein